MADTDTDPYWVGAFAMSLARAHAWLLNGRPDVAYHEIDSVLIDFSESGIWQDDPMLVDSLKPYWKPPQPTAKELTHDSNDVRSLRPGD